jgi:membrane-associated phospholipid phosphatase
MARAGSPPLALLLTLSFVICPGAGYARADSLDAAEFASGAGTVIYVSGGVLLPLWTDGGQGKDHALRAADALLASSVLSETLKRMVQEKRPDSNQRDSFPSEHTTIAFAVATAESHFHTQQAPYWYAGAAAIGWSRVRLGRHYCRDVVAGAALGYLTTHWALSRPKGLILTPLIHPSGAAGVQVVKLF